MAQETHELLWSGMQTHDFSQSDINHKRIGRSLTPRMLAQRPAISRTKKRAFSVPLLTIYKPFQPLQAERRRSCHPTPIKEVELLSYSRQPSACTTVAYSLFCKGVAVKCQFEDDVSLLLLPLHTVKGSGNQSGADRTSVAVPTKDNESAKGKVPAQDLGFLRIDELQEKLRQVYGKENPRVVYTDREGDEIKIDSDDSLNYAFNDWRGMFGKGKRWNSPMLSPSGVPSSWRLRILPPKNNGSKRRGL